MSNRPRSQTARYVEVEVNGVDTTIEEALRTIERIRRPASDPLPNPKRLRSIERHQGNGDNELTEEPTLFDDRVADPSEAGTAELEPDPGVDTVTTTDPTRKKRGEGERKDRNAGIKPVGDINFVPNGKPSLKDFFIEKAPGSDMDQILVVCHFLQHTLESSQIGPGHILSGFKHVGKPIPKDLKQTIRNMKEKKAWLGFADIENIRLTTEGDNRVEHEIGKGKGSGDSGAQ